MDCIVYPTDFGDKLYSPLVVWKAAEWKVWAKVISSIVLHGCLSEPYYGEWINLVKVISLATDYSIYTTNIPCLHTMMIRYVPLAVNVTLYFYPANNS